MKSNKLQNIKAIQEMLDGSHRFQTRKTIGFSDVDSKRSQSQIRNVGDEWEEVDPVTGIITVIEQKDGFRVKKSKNTDVLQSARDYTRTFTNCQKESCTCIKPNHLDEKMRKVNGMCYDCTIDYEHKLKISGEFSSYARDKIKKNAIAWLRQAEQEVEMLKQIYTQSTKAVTNSDGLIETISAQMTAEEFDEKVQKVFDEFKQDFLKKINGTDNENDME